MFCPNCGTPLADDAKFCANCGTRTGDAPQAQAPVYQAPVAETPVYQPLPEQPAVQPEAPVYQQPEYQQPAPQAPAPKKKSKAGLIIGVVLALVAIGVAAFFLWPKDGKGDKKKSSPYGNTYESPVKIMEAQSNATSYTTVFEQLLESANGFAGDELEQIISIMKKAEDYDEELKDAKEYFNENLEELKDEYGSNFKYTYKIESKNALDQDDLDYFIDGMKDAIDRNGKPSDLVDDMDAFAEELGLSTANTKKLVNACDDIYNKLSKAKITEGYTLTVTTTLTGSNLLEASVNTTEITVYKIDGYWVTNSTIAQLFYMVRM